MKPRAVLALLAILGLSGGLSAVPAAGEAAEKAAAAQNGHAVEKGNRHRLRPWRRRRARRRTFREGQEAVIRFRLSDVATGTPVAGSSPAAWLDRAEAANSAGGGTCTEAVEQLLSGSFFRRPAVDLNAYLACWRSTTTRRSR